MNSFDGKNSPQNQLFIDVCGCQTINNSDEHMHQFRWSDYHILYAVEGNGYVKIDGKSVELSAGTLLMFLPLQYRDYGFSKEKRSKFYYIIIKLTVLDSLSYIHNRSSKPLNYYSLYYLKALPQAL